ncbi:hypothetical protein BOX15_Mlig007293g1 [Macrostomum lignano]|uniref:Uncharacterized protein n=1 Tax=Macrostomum lignano TaxID=282301 RepID=A0A267E412_9PLAT|nr:hypothetical protein BOX15_Mlig007293g1 [Macrostomum lignano]
MLADLVRNRHELEGLVLPRHWMRQFFLVAAYVRLHESGKAELLLNELTAAHGGCLADCAYLMRYLGIVKDQQRSMGEAKAVFKQLFESDRCALDGADVYSNILYVDNNHSLMADLAHQCVLVDSTADLLRCWQLLRIKRQSRQGAVLFSTGPATQARLCFGVDPGWARVPGIEAGEQCYPSLPQGGHLQPGGLPRLVRPGPRARIKQQILLRNLLFPRMRTPVQYRSSHYGCPGRELQSG